MSITKKDAVIQAEKIINQVLQGKKDFSEVLNGVKAKEDSVRYPHTIALEVLSEKNSGIVYPE